MNDNKLSIRQICLIYIAFLLAGKLISMPALTATWSRESCWISALINLTVDGILCFFILRISERFPEKTFYEILEDNIGKFAVKVIFILYSVYFLLRSYIPILEQKNYIELTLYETSPNIWIFIPFFTISCFLSYKGLQSFGRCADIAVWFTVVAVTVIGALSVSNADFSNLLPIIGVKFKDVLTGARKSTLWYFDSTYLLFLLGHFKAEKLQKTKIMTTFSICGIVLLGYIAILVGEFGAIAERQFFAPVRMGKFGISTANIGRIDYIAGFALAISCVFTVAIPLAFSSYALNTAFNFKSPIIPAIIVNSISLLSVLITEDFYYGTLPFVQDRLIYFLIFMAYVLPLIMIFFKKGSVKK